jgi:hypothetical protein
MGLTNEHVGPIILAKIKIYVLNRAELLFNLCYEIPCIWDGDISWTMTSCGHYFSKGATSRGHSQRMTFRGHFW